MGLKSPKKRRESYPPWPGHLFKKQKRSMRGELRKAARCFLIILIFHQAKVAFHSILTNVHRKPAREEELCIE